MSDIVISNTTPIITLLSLGKLDLLRELYDKIYIPQAVYQEIEDGKHKPFYTDLKQLSWIEIKTVQNELALSILSNDLDKGEAEAIILYKEMNANLLIIDEKLGRQEAENKNCIVTGSLGVLIAAKQVGLIEEIKPLLLQARANGIRISDKLFNAILEKAGE